jgi:hypothetical protein
MLSRKSAGVVLFVSFLMLSGLAVADDGDMWRGTTEALTGTNFDLTLSESPRPAIVDTADSILFSGAFSQPGIWTLSIRAHGTQAYILTAIVTGTGESGFTGVDIQSSTATPAGYFSPIVLASNPVPTSFVPEPSTASFLTTGICFAAGTLRRRALTS